MSRADITLTVNPGRIGIARSSDRSASLTDEDSSSGVDVHLSPSSDLGSQESSSDREFSTEDYEGDSWEQLSKADVVPSESASRPSTSNHHRIPEAPLRHRSRREVSHSRPPHRPSRTRHPQPSSPGSVGSNEEILPYGPGLPRPRPYIHWTSAAGGQNHQYAPSYSAQSYSPYQTSSGIPPGQQLIPFSSQPTQYPYSPYQQQQQPGNAPSYFGHGSAAGHPGVAGPMGSPVVPQSGVPYGHEIMHPTTVPAYYPYPQQPYPMSHPIPSPVYQPYQPVYHPPPLVPPSSSPAQSEAPKDDGYAELKQMLITEKAEREAREAAEKERLAAAEAAKTKADEIAAAAAEAAKAATTEAEKKAAAEKEEAANQAKEAAEKAKAEAEEATAKLKAEAEEAAAKAKEEKEAAIAAATAGLMLPPEEKKKPIKFKDAVGRKFSFPFHLCATWEGMEDLIRQAFLHVDIIGPHVVEGHYDLIGPNNEIILPGVWETVIEPDWTITMHMWPMPEPKPEEPVVDVPEPAPAPGPQTGKKGKNKRGVPPAAPAADVPPPPPPAPLAPDGVIDAQAGPKKKPPKGSFWFGARPKPKPKQPVKK